MALLSAVSLLAVGCKATSTLNVAVQENGSGTVKFALELDEEAASVVRSDSYKATSLSKIFDTKKLQDVGFEVEVKENTNGDPSKIEMSAPFSNEKELNEILSVLAPQKVLNATFVKRASITKEKLDTTMTVDVSMLRELYLEDEDVKAAVEEAGIEFSEFNDLVDSAFKSTTLEVDLQGNIEKFSGKNPRAATLGASQSVLRTRFLLNISAALVCGLIGIVMIWRLCRRPRLLSKKSVSEK